MNRNASLNKSIFTLGNLSFEATDDDLKQVFESFGQVIHATIIEDKYGSESKEFRFVEMPSKVEAYSAIE